MRRLVPLAAVVACGLAACGSDTVDTAQIEQGIEKSLSTSGVKVTKADCPSDVKKEKGDTFNCTVSLSNGGTGKVKVTQDGANHYTYAFVPGSVQIPGSYAEEQIQKELESEGISGATVNCPDNIIVKVGTTVTCNVSGAKAVAQVTFTFSEEDGEVDPSSVSTS